MLIYSLTDDKVRFILERLIEFNRDNVNELLKLRSICRWSYHHIRKTNILNDALIKSGYGQKPRCSICFARKFPCCNLRCKRDENADFLVDYLISKKGIISVDLPGICRLA